MVNQNEIINIATINLNGETWSSINRRPRLPQKLYDIQHIKEELTKSTKEGIKIILEKDIYDIIAVQELVFSEKERAEIETVIEEIKDATGKTIYELICPQFLKRNPHFIVGYIVRKNLQAEINTINDKNTLSNNRISKLKFTICDKEFSIINMHVNKYTIDIPVGNENTILLGDMNACTENQATDNKAINVKFLKRIKNKGWIEVESNEPIYTWKSNGIEKKLDHIYIYKDLDNQQSIVTSAEPAVNFYYNQSGFTDHTMLVIEFPVININSSLQR